MKIFKTISPKHMWSGEFFISKNVKLPLSACKGTETQRYTLAENYSHQLKNKLDEVSIGSNCLVEDYKDAINEILSPNKINFEIQPIEKGRSLGTIKRDFETYSNVNNIGGVKVETTKTLYNKYSLGLPLKKDNKIISDKYTALHEARHMFDHICNPKTITMRSMKFLYDEEQVENFKDLYKMFIDDFKPFYPMPLFRKKAVKTLSKMTNEQSIDSLQDIRQTIKTEINAYKDTLNYMSKRPLNNLVHYVGSMEFFMVANYDKKLKFANELLKEKLFAERNQIHCKNLKKKN